MSHLYQTCYRSPIGLIELTATDAAIKSLNFVEADTGGDALTPPLLRRCIHQLEAYFRGERRAFDLPLAPDGTEFQQQVWRQLQAIPFGQTASYLEVAQAIGNEKAVRAVGAANGQNPISIIIPCHRVIGSDGTLTGYGGGLWRKKWLLGHERKFTVGQQMSFFNGEE